MSLNRQVSTYDVGIDRLPVKHNFRPDYTGDGVDAEAISSCHTTVRHVEGVVNQTSVSTVDILGVAVVDQHALVLALTNRYIDMAKTQAHTKPIDM